MTDLDMNRLRELSKEGLRRCIAEGRMTAKIWDNLSLSTREAVRDNSALTPQLIGLEGWRVEVCDPTSKPRRFIVGRSTGWKPCHLEIRTSRSMGGVPAAQSYLSIRKIERVR